MIRNINELNALRDLAKAKMEGYEQQLLICGGTGCVSSGSLKLYERLQEEIAKQNDDCLKKLCYSAIDKCRIVLYNSNRAMRRTAEENYRRRKCSVR